MNRYFPLLLAALFIQTSASAQTRFIPGISVDDAFVYDLNNASVPDYAREKRIADEIEPQIFDGEAVWLNANSHNFLSIYLAAENSQGTVLLLHGRDSNPSGQEVIEPLRLQLATHGWSSLSLQMPVFKKGAKYYDYLASFPYANGRIDAAITYVKTLNKQPILMAAHSCGAHMANHWFNSRTYPHGINGFISISLGATDALQEIQTPFPFARLKFPILDIYGDQDFPRPLATVSIRKQQLEQSGNRYSQQKVVAGADHYFKSKGDELSAEIMRWIQDTAFD